MKIELKKLKVHPDMSEETNCFSAEVWADGKLIAYAKNDGGGGCTNIYPSSVERDAPARQLLKDAEAYAATLPAIPSKYSNEGLNMNLEFYVDMLVAVHLVAKDNKSMGFVKWDVAQKAQHDASGIQYPEFHLWHNQGKSIYYPQKAY